MFVLSATRIEVVGSRICHVAAGVIGYDGDVITYLVLVRVAFKWSKRIAHCHIGRPGDAPIGAVGVEQLRVGVVGNRVARVVPHSVQTPIRRYGECAEPMPLIGKAVVIDPVWRAEG